jgi:hypothetical protein
MVQTPFARHIEARRPQSLRFSRFKATVSVDLQPSMKADISLFLDRTFSLAVNHSIIATQLFWE